MVNANISNLENQNSLPKIFLSDIVHNNNSKIIIVDEKSFLHVPLSSSL